MDRGVVHVLGELVSRAPVTGIEHLTVADGRPVGITDRGELLFISTRSVRTVTGQRVPHGPQVVVGSARGAGRWILVVDKRAGRLVAVDSQTGAKRGPYAVPRSGADHNVDAPVQVGDKAYVPDYQQGKLIGYDVATGAELPDVEVPGESPRFELFVENGRVWANDPTDRRTRVIDQDDQPRLGDKGDGPGVATDEGKPAEPEEPRPDSEPREREQPRTEPPAGPSVSEPEPTTEQPEVDLVTVPDVSRGEPKSEACARIEGAGLTCAPVAAGEGGPTDTVIDVQPASGARVPEGTAVVVRHYGQAAVPTVTGALIDQACALVDSAGFTCDRRPAGTQAAALDGLGVVVAQDPGAGGNADTGAPVTLTYVDRAAVADYRGRDGGQACQEIVQQSRQQITCTSVNGGTQQQTGQPPGTVLQRDPAVVGIGGAVTLTIVVGSPLVPDLLSQNVDAACEAIRATYVCDPRADALARHGRTVITQEPAPGTPLDPGSPVVVHYSPEEPEAVRLFRARNGDPVWVLRVGNGDPGLNDYYDTQNPKTIGYAYVKGRVQPGATTTVRDFYCTVGPSACGGFEKNHYYSTGAAPPPGSGLDQFESYDTALFLDACTMPGQIEIHRWRYWADGKRRYYAGPTQPSANWTAVERLGCIWAS